MIENKLCLCSKRILNTQDVTYLVPLHGEPTPACSHACYERWLEREAFAAELRRREQAARDMAAWTFTSHHTMAAVMAEEDRMPREVYAGNRRYGDI